MSKKYSENSIIELTQIEHIQRNPGMYIGNSENFLKILEECVDNSLDEILNNPKSRSLGLIINTKENFFEVIDDGRGFPFNPKLSTLDDIPVKAVTKLFTSGKFTKGSNDSSYTIASGVHGVGMCAVFSLSKQVVIEIYRDDKHAVYNFYDADISKTTRIIEDYAEEKPFSTSVKCYPDEKFFGTMELPIDIIKERLKIASANIKDLKIYLEIDGNGELINNDENQLIKEYLSDSENNKWISLDYNKNPESYNIKFAWTDETITPKFFSSVNLIKLDGGIHINKIISIIKNYFSNYSKKYNFNPMDSLVGLKCYLNLKIIKTSFSGQSKQKLESKSDISIMNKLESQIIRYFEDNKDYLIELLEKFSNYRKSIESKGLVIKSVKGKRGSTEYTKLRDCLNRDGIIYIVEGQSAAGGIIKSRDPKNIAVLPLKGKSIPNVIKATDILKNVEVNELIRSLGTGINADFDINKLRYDKICIATDADQDGCIEKDEKILVNKNKKIISFEELYNKYGEYPKNLKTLGYDAINNKFVETNIIKIWNSGEFLEYLNIILDDNNSFKVTFEHLILTLDGYKKAIDLKENNIIIGTNNKKIKEINIIKEKSNFYDITTTTGNFVLSNSGIVVHNSHIKCLIIMCLATLVPEVIKTGHLYYAETPLYCINEKKLFKPLWTKEELEEARNKKYNILRVKGLGELSDNQLKIVLLDPGTRRLVKIDYTDNMEYYIKLFGDVEEKRKLLEERNL